jgi:hypothetical protein
MNPDYLWLIELLTFFLVGPVLAIAIAYAAWRGKRNNFNPKRYEIVVRHVRRDCFSAIWTRQVDER